MTVIIDGTAGITFPNSTTQLVAGAPLTTPSFTTTIGVGAATASASGAGISFPATQSASTNANTLDDYEEGTWTPAQGACVVVGTFSSTGTYTKIGRQVVITGKLSGSTSISVGVDVLTTGLPFAIVGTDAVGTTTNNSANISVLNDGNASAMYSCGVISATSNIFFSLTYFTS
jgi:hypothetical protein